MSRCLAQCDQYLVSNQNLPNGTVHKRVDGHDDHRPLGNDFGTKRWRREHNDHRERSLFAAWARGGDGQWREPRCRLTSDSAAREAYSNTLGINVGALSNTLVRDGGVVNIGGAAQVGLLSSINIGHDGTVRLGSS